MSYSAPPGLEAQATPESQEVGTAAIQIMEDKLSQLGPNASRQEVIEVIRTAVMQEVEQRVKEKADDMWTRGKQMMGQMQQKHKEKTQLLTEEVARCTERQRALEAENEKLKEVLEGLAGRLAVIGNVFNQKNVASPGRDSTAPGNSPAVTEGSSPLQFTPASFTPTTSALTLEGKLPDVPAFPFPAQMSPCGTPAPLSLVEALGAQTPQRTPLSLASSLAPTTPEMASPFITRSPVFSTGIFSFTLRKADGADLGLNVSHSKTEQVLNVEGVRADGAVEAWNKQCAGSIHQEKTVIVGDRIIGVNSIAYDPEKMLEECRDKQLLKLTIVRAGRPLPQPQACASLKPTALRADASVFVPSPGNDVLAAEETREAPADATADRV